MKNSKKMMAIMISSATLSACMENVNIDGPTTDIEIITAEINASDYATPAYYDLNTASIVSETDDWDIAFRRNTITVNDNKKTAIADRQTEKFSGEGRGETGPWSDAELANIVNATPSTEEADFIAINGLPEVEEFLASDLVPAIKSSDFYTVIGQGGQGFEAQSDNWYYLTNSSGDGYAQMNVSAFSNDGAVPGKPYLANIDFYVEDENGFSETVSSTWDFDFAVQGERCYDFDAGITVECTDNAYDIKGSIVSRNIVFTLNGNAKVAGPQGYNEQRQLVALTKTSYATGDDQANRANPIFNSYNVDKKQNSFEDNAFYAYDPQGLGNHQLVPYYRTYLVDTDAASEDDVAFKLQVLSYYSEEGASANYTVRFAELSASTDD